MKLVDLKTKTDAELQALLIDTRASIAKLTVEMRTQKLPNVKQLAAYKKLVARILTLVRERELTKLEESHG